MDTWSGSSGGGTPSSTLARRRRRDEVDRLPGGITAREKTDPPRTRAQEVPSGVEGLRVIIIDSDERRDYEQAKREKSMERARQTLEKLQARVAAGKLKQPEKIGAAAERILQRNHGYRYFDWKLDGGASGTPRTRQVWRVRRGSRVNM